MNKKLIIIIVLVILILVAIYFFSNPDKMTTFFSNKSGTDQGGGNNNSGGKPSLWDKFKYVASGKIVVDKAKETASNLAPKEVAKDISINPVTTTKNVLKHFGIKI